jgi:hypothetical protein
VLHGNLNDDAGGDGRKERQRIVKCGGTKFAVERERKPKMHLMKRLISLLCFQTWELLANNQEQKKKKKQRSENFS